MSALKDKYDWNSVKKDRVIVLEKDKKTRKRERVGICGIAGNCMVQNLYLF